MFVKVMGLENAPDDDCRKTFDLFAKVAHVKFHRVQSEPDVVDGAYIRMIFDDGTQEGFLLRSNVYLLNDAGKTIERFGPESLPKYSIPEAE